MAGGWRRGHRRAGVGRPLLLLIAGVWLALTFAALLGLHSGAAAHALNPVVPNSPLVTSTTSAPTDTPVAPTDTPVVTATPSATAADTPTDTPIATSTSVGAGGTSGVDSSGPQPTKVSFAQPTIGASGGGGVSGSGGGITSSGLLIASLLSCGVTVMGIIIAAVALRKLVAGGYGPFLKALLPFSKRWMNKRQARALGGETELGARDERPYEYDDSREWSARDGGWQRSPRQASPTRGRNGGPASRAAPRPYGSTRERR